MKKEKPLIKKKKKQPSAIRKNKKKKGEITQVSSNAPTKSTTCL